ncbi:MAG: cytidylate kinase-like family protein [Nonomuraea sp.]|nr:cytidylate kinase-like family protein [Nonomuraea sp.]NUP63961.1 cytidylate kinase-like family protein [Nonomuraea sp.]NUP79760.1 cytidylate kinase-like family protein [Nonomuraea sp.]NUS01085.1 cytidylate kinase-like family protein [Nonomuraea sp.]NUT41549.1 cytidylate kinase-like family protein [Thermoactinospora sp.]
MRVVTISAAYGTAGSHIGPAVAERLGVPFVDRAIPGAVAQELGCTLEEALAHDDRAEHGLGRLLSGAIRLPTVTFGGVDMYVPGAMPLPAEEFVRRTERMLKETAAAQGGVFLGRAGALVLAGHPGALHVRLDAPLDRRVLQTATLGEMSEREARRVIEDNDRARTAYVRHFYRADAADARHYHLVLDSTTIPVPTCVELIVTAAEALD